jgi:hypothetical protein
VDITELPIEDTYKAIQFSLHNQERSPGLHLSDVLDDMETTIFGDQYRNYSWNLNWSATLGFIWERIIETHIVAALTEQGLLFSPGEITKDGIAMTPDGYNADGKIEEWKCAWKSSRHPIEESHRYLWQIKSYCYGIGVNEATLRVLHIMGDYKGSGPLPRFYELVFTDRELNENWEMIVNHAKARGML